MQEMNITVEISARHVHVTKEHLEALFGAGHELEVRKYLSQPGEFASTDKVSVVTEKGEIKGVSILGPCRAYTQVELSLTDARAVGLVPQVRESSDIEGTDGCTLVGPAGSVELGEGVIVAKRHVHFTPGDAEKLGVRDKQIIRVRVEGPRAMVFDEVVARVSPRYATYMHIDFDEANGAGLSGESAGTILL